MTIEFHCPFCQKLLKTPDDKAGVRANCPGCGEMVTVPSPQQEAAHADSSLDRADQAAHEPHAGASAASAASVAEASADGPDETKACPMCGASIKAAARRCRFCGEQLIEHRPEGVPTPIEAGDVLTRAWEIFKNNVGILVGATVVMFGIGMAVNMVGQLVQGILTISILGPMGAAGGGKQPPDTALVLLVVYVPAVLFGFLNFAVNCYIQAGLNRLLLKVARGESAEFSEMFSGGPYFWRFFLANLLFSLMLYGGLLFFIIPGIYVMLAFWPFMYLIVDRDMGVMESFSRARELTSGNYLAFVVLGLAALGAQMAGLLACCVGVIFSTPFVMLLFAVAYCMMSGQAVANTRNA